MTEKQIALRILATFKIPIHMVGYQMLLDCIVLAYRNRWYLDRQLCTLYYDVGVIHSRSQPATEKALRDAIVKAGLRIATGNFIKGCVFFMDYIDNREIDAGEFELHDIEKFIA